MREIDKIIVHCSATPEGREVTVAQITEWHRARGFRTIGYHYLVGLDGSVSRGRPEAEVGAHCTGQNARSIGVCYVGGLDRDTLRPKDTRTPAQRESLRRPPVLGGSGGRSGGLWRSCVHAIRVPRSTATASLPPRPAHASMWQPIFRPHLTKNAMCQFDTSHFLSVYCSLVT